MRRFFLLTFLACLLAFAQGKKYQPKQEKLPGDPVPQPIAYSHKTHVALGLQCLNCHTMPGEGLEATYPPESFCMGCHQSVKVDSPEIQKLAAYAREKKRIPWVRIYQVPDMVWFNHTLHVKEARIECSLCHGDVAQRDVLFKEKSTGMMACMDCHALRQAPNGCDTCHPSQ
ncbi:MAG: cytochrome c3 family protein [Bryobacteraceae bacterium]|nr:cytochrome c3 family protein [Bryobacteraceae bacterium]MDW8377771.1 cytochrome c3 family protein [Bryobacterales bacterium]